jgi:hypothetical protein
MGLLESESITRLATVTGVDLNSVAAQTLYTVPLKKENGADVNGCVITHVVVRNVSLSLTTVAFSLGWTSAAFNDLIANASHTELTGATLYTVLIPKIGALLGVAAAVLKLLCNTPQGAAATCDIDVFGYLV